MKILPIVEIENDPYQVINNTKVYKDCLKRQKLLNKFCGATIKVFNEKSTHTSLYEYLKILTCDISFDYNYCYIKLHCFDTTISSKYKLKLFEFDCIYDYIVLEMTDLTQTRNI